jgi:hypothetical protein
LSNGLYTFPDAISGDQKEKSTQPQGTRDLVHKSRLVNISVSFADDVEQHVLALALGDARHFPEEVFIHPMRQMGGIFQNLSNHLAPGFGVPPELGLQDHQLAGGVTYRASTYAFDATFISLQTGTSPS